jgi:IS30 family transposase
MKKREFTITEFAARIGVHHSTVWRWIKDNPARLKMYDAEVVEVAGKKFVKIKSE